METNQLNDLIKSCQNEMLDWYNIQVSKEKAEEFITSNNVESFDTVERENFANEIALKVTGMSWPMNGDSDEYKKEFWAKWNLPTVSK